MCRYNQENDAISLGKVTTSAEQWPLWLSEITSTLLLFDGLACGLKFRCSTRIEELYHPRMCAVLKQTLGPLFSTCSLQWTSGNVNVGGIFYSEH
jgi:hypothetical protein